MKPEELFIPLCVGKDVQLDAWIAYRKKHAMIIDFLDIRYEGTPVNAVFVVCYALCAN